MSFVTPPEDSPFHTNAAEHIKWSILKTADTDSLTVDSKRQELLASAMFRTDTKDNQQAKDDTLPDDSEANGPQSARISTKPHSQVLFAALAPPSTNQDTNQQTNEDGSPMKLKRTTVLSGNFAKKNPMSARGRAASENVQLVGGDQRKYSLVGGLGLGLGETASVKEEENDDGAADNEIDQAKD